jgi:dienelactone hydrolase
VSDAVTVEPVSFEREGQPCAGLLARPATSEPAAAVVLMPAIAGINDYIQRVACSLAVTGFVCYAPDYYVREEKAPDLSSRESIMRAVAELPDPRVGDDLRRATAHLREYEFVRESSIGVLGFCIGGTYRNLSSRMRRLALGFSESVPRCRAC